MPARTGKEFLQGLKDDREIWVGSERVRDVAAHPAFAGAAVWESAAAIATLHDPVVIRKLLAHLGMAPSGPSPGPAPPESGGAAS